MGSSRIRLGEFSTWSTEILWNKISKLHRSFKIIRLILPQNCIVFFISYLNFENNKRVSIKLQSYTRSFRLGESSIRFFFNFVFITFGLVQCAHFMHSFKDNFQNNPKCRLINPAKSEIGIISKHYIEEINKCVRRGILFGSIHHLVVMLKQM